MTRSTDTLGLVWTAHRKWSQVAGSAKEHLTTWRRRNLTLLVTGAVLGALAAQTWIPVVSPTVFAVLAAIVLAVAAILQQQFLGPDRVGRLTAARAASEALKAETFRYLAGVAPYDDPATRDAGLLAALGLADQRSAAFVVDYTNATDDGTTALPAISGMDDYVRDRAVHQRDWHHAKVAGYERQAQLFRNAELAATLLAAVLALLASAFPDVDLAAWVALATTLGATFAAHLLAAQYDKLALTYATTTRDLDRLIDARALTTPTPESDAAFVRDVEDLLARQNEGWVGLLGS